MRKQKIKRTKQKIEHTYEDFYTADDLRDPTIKPHLNITIEDFDKRGHLVNPPAPCIVTAIDPDYLVDAGRQKLVPKFRMKTDILKLREITRKKFMIYATKQMHLEQQFETRHQNEVHDRIVELHKFIGEALTQIESEAFSEMMATKKELEKLKEVTLDAEYKKLLVEQQSVVMEVKDVYERFLFLLKLIGYFDANIDWNDDDGEEIKLPKPEEITGIEISEKHLVGNKEVELLQNYMDKVVRPYLAKRSHLNADIWITGYEIIRRKMFNYNKRLMELGMLNHLFMIISNKFEKSFKICSEKAPFFKDTKFLEDRIAMMRTRAHEITNECAKSFRKDKLQMKMDAVVSVIWDLIQKLDKPPKPLNGGDEQKKQKKSYNGRKEKAEANTERYTGEPDTTLMKVEKLQAYLFDMLAKLDTMPPERCRAIEKEVRRKMRVEKEMSRRALVKQNRLHNWLEHFKKHAASK